MRNLEGKTAFVTGAASGIGLGIATALAQAGVKVMLCDIEEQRLTEAVDALERTNANVAGVRADVSQKAEIAAAAEATIARYGKVHILVSNAGVGGGGGPYGYWSEAAWDWILGVNLRAAIWSVEIFSPLIEKHSEGGHIVGTASAVGLVSPSSVPYNVSKYGAVALFEGLRNDLAPRGIGVSILCPGFTRTRLAESLRNLPPRFDQAGRDDIAGGFSSARYEKTREGISKGLDPLYVGQLVREGIQSDWQYIFTDTEFESLIDARFAAIKRGFDQIRDRTPRH